MITVLIVFASGILIGYFIRKKKKVIRINDLLTNGAIFLLLFILGLAVGSNDEIISNVEVIGLNAFLISTFAVLGSVLLAWLFNKLFFKSKS
jgi:uncharacterized membrane protein YbjE (DUF340 family)